MPPLRRCYREQNTDGRHLRDRRKRLIVVDAVLLRVAFRHQPSLVPVDRAVGVVLDLVHPPTSDRLHPFRCVNQVLGLVLRQGVHLFLHHGTPICVLGRLCIALRLTHFRYSCRVRIMMHHVLIIFEPQNGVFLAGRST